MLDVRRERINSVAVFLIVLLCYAYFFPRWADPNQNSRLDMVVSVVDDGTFQIDKYVANTVDYAKVGEHYYSDKAPGIALLGIPVYAGLRVALNLPVIDRLTERLANSQAFQSTLRQDGSGVLEEKVRFAIAQVVLSFLLSAVPTALMCALMYRLSARFAAGEGVRLAVVFGYGLLTPAFAYANAFFGHQLSAALLFFAFFWLFKADPAANDQPARLSPPAFVAIGLLLGYSVVTEYPAALIAGALALYALYILYRMGQWRHIVWLGAGIAICAAGLMLYNTAIFGGPFKLGYSSSELWTHQHSTGFMSLTLPHLDAVWGITFGSFRGLLFYAPLLLLAAPGFAFWWRSRECRAAFWVALFSTLSMFVFNASSMMWWGGFAIGPRYLLPGLPFMALAVVFCLRQVRRIGFIALTVALFAWSFIAVWGLTLAEQAFPSDAIRDPLLQYALPNWQIGNIARSLGTLLGFQGVTGLLPLAISVAAIGLVWRLAISRAVPRPGAAKREHLRDPIRPATDSTL